MASYLSSLGSLNALRDQLELRLGALLGHKGTVAILNSKLLPGDPKVGDMLAIYLYRVAVDPFARNRHLPPAAGRTTPRPELPVNLHILIMGWSDKSEEEITNLSAAMQVIGSSLSLDASHLALTDPSWGDSDTLQVIPEEMSTEDLARLWESLPGGYRLSVPYIVKTLRLEPAYDAPEAPWVQTIVYPLNVGAGETS